MNEKWNNNVRGANELNGQPKKYFVLNNFRRYLMDSLFISKMRD